MASGSLHWRPRSGTAGKLAIHLLVAAALLFGARSRAPELRAPADASKPATLIPSLPDPAALAEGPKLEVVQDPVSFGTMFDDETASVSIGLRNGGTTALHLNRILPSCGCLHPAKPPAVLEPGERADVPVAIRLAGMLGPFAKSVTVESDDPASPFTRVQIAGQVRRRLTVTPSVVVLNSPTLDASLSFDLDVRNESGDPLTGLGATSAVPGLSLTLTVTGPAARVHGILDPWKPNLRGTVVLRLGKSERIVPVTTTSRATPRGAGAHSDLATGDAPRRAAPPPTGDPRLTVAFSGEDEGQIEPCGCSPGMPGGLARRPARIRASVTTGAPLAIVSGGRLVAGSEAYDGMRLGVILRALRSMGCEAFAPSARELGLGLGALGDLVREAGVPLVAANASARRGQGDTLRRLRKLGPTEADVYVTGLCEEVEGDGLVVTDPGRALRSVRALLPPHAALVVLANLDEGTARALARNLAGPTLVLCAAGDTNPRDVVAAASVVVAPYPAEGTFLGLAQLAGRGAEALWTVEYRPLVAELPEDEGVVELRTKYLAELRTGDLVRKSAASARFAVSPAPADGETYAGSAVCADCHAAEAAVWEKSRHASALASLRRTGDDADPGCVRCHVVGYGTGRGFVTDSETAPLAAVGCEACHGSYGRHVQAMRSGTGDAKSPPAGERSCRSCHDGRHSPEFEFGTYWGRIAHGTK